jgi:hypothetical protein
MGVLQFRSTKMESLPPDEAKAGDIFSRLGYKISDAIADLVDNSVDAEASKVHVRFIRGLDGIHSVLIADNGGGMSSNELKEAMRFGSRTIKSGKQLGKYGIGLKSASLSQAETVTVLSRRRKETVGRRWTLENVKNDWMSELLDARDVARGLTTQFGDFRIKRSGTVVIWERLEHLRALPSNLEQVLGRTIDNLCVELGIRFHRFLEDGRLTITIDQQFGLEEPSEISIRVLPLNPFSYERSGHAAYPIATRLKLQSAEVPVELHIWPAKSKAAGYRLGGGKVSLRQGFYFYRNDRVIQAGGWNGVRADDAEPHLSLARVQVELPSSLDSMFKLDVTKSTLDPSPLFMAALSSASAKGVSFEKYIADAERVYRRQKTKDAARFPVIPGAGLSRNAQRAVAGILEEKGAVRPDEVRFKWARLDPDEVFRVESDQKAILLNSRYKANLLEGDSGDAPVLKLVLMFLLQDELSKTFATRKSREWLQRVNLSLIASMKE